MATLPVPAAAAGLNVSVSAVEISPTAPEPGETVTVTPTIQNLQGSSDSMKLEVVAVRKAGGGITEYARVKKLGTLSPGSSLDVPLTVQFDNPGTKNLRVLVFGHPPDKPTEPIRIRYPVTVTVTDRSPQIDIQTNESIDGIDTGGTVTIANGLQTQLSNVEVAVSGTGVEMTESRSVLATLDAGETATAPFTYRPETPGPHALEATVTYTVDGESERTTNDVSRSGFSPCFYEERFPQRTQ